jgi:hypothetical protein
VDVYIDGAEGIAYKNILRQFLIVLQIVNIAIKKWSPAATYKTGRHRKAK